MSLEQLVKDYDAVFLGMGLAGVNAIGIAEPQASGMRNAVEFIAELRQAGDYAQVPVGRRVVVIGGGMTAVDAAVQSQEAGRRGSHHGLPARRRRHVGIAATSRTGRAPTASRSATGLRRAKCCAVMAASPACVLP